VEYLKLDRILVPTDLSRGSGAAADAACNLAAPFEGRITLLHVCEAEAIETRLRSLGAHAASRARYHAAVQHALRRLCDGVARVGARARTVIIDGLVPWRTICDYAGDHAYDMIVVTRSTSSAAGAATLGSVAERVLSHAPCRVLVAPALLSNGDREPQVWS